MESMQKPGTLVFADVTGLLVRYDSEVTYFHSYIDGVDIVFLDAPPFGHCHNDIYGGERMDILKRMILFYKAVVEVCSPIILVPWYVPCGGVVYGDGNLVFSANDWHTALLPVYLKAYYRENGLMQFTRSVLIIHNIPHQIAGLDLVDDESKQERRYGHSGCWVGFVEHFGEQECGNTDIEGVDSSNTCYGGTTTLFNFVDRVGSNSWDGHYGLVVCTDSAALFLTCILVRLV